MHNYTQKFLILMACLLLPALQAYSQVQVKGTVTEESGEPVIGVQIQEQGTTNGTITDVDGGYTLNVSEGATLIYSFIGFETQKIPVNGRSVIDVQMTEDVQQLEEVVVTALGFEADKDKVAYANTQVQGETVTKAAEPNLVNSLSGKASGVRITRSSGDPGAGSYIQIRGLTTLTRDNQPLIVVDGVPISNDSRGTSQIAQQSRLNDINPNDIKNISVLKGASAAALWGTKAYGGVIVITTKSGAFNQPLKVSLKSTFSLDEINRRHPMQDKFGQGNDGVYDPAARDSWGDKIADRSGGQDDFNTTGEYFVDQDGTVHYPILQKNSQRTYIDDNFNEVFDNGHFLENNLSLTAGNETGRLFFSLSNLNQDGIIKNNSDYNRTTMRFNGEQLLANNLTLNGNFAYTRTNSNRIRAGAQSSGLYLGLLRTPPDFDNTGYRGSYYAGPDAQPIPNRHRSYRRYLASSSNPVYNNPSWTINEQEDIATVNRFINKLSLTYNPTDWLELIGRAGLDTYTEEKSQFFTPGSASGAFRTGLFEREVATKQILNMDYIARANHRFNSKFNGSMLLGFNYNRETLTVSESEIVNFIQFADVDGNTRDMDNAAPENRSVQSTIGEERTAGVYTEINFNAYEQLFFTGTLRAESASTFGTQSDATFYFPSVSLAWQFTEVLDFKPLTFGKLRGSYGEVGVQPLRYNTVTEFVQPTYSDEWGGGLWTALYGGGGFTQSVNLANPFLVPERLKEFEIGTDLRFFGDRLTFSGSYFQNETEDVLLNFPIANTRGYDEQYDNGATIQNKGIEMDLGYTILKTEDLTWNANLIYTRVRNEVTDLRGIQSLNLGGLSAANARAIEGEPLGVLFGSRILRDDAGNIVFDENGFPVQDEQEGVIGNPNPDWQGSLMTTVRYKNLGLSLLFETFQGSDIYAGTKAVLDNLGTSAETGIETTTDVNLLDYNGNLIPAGTTFRGTVKDFGAGPVALTEAWYQADGGFFGAGNDELFIEDGSWTRLREVIISYGLPAKWMNSIGFESAEVSITGRNLILWTDFKGNDPDTNLEGVSAARGIEYFNNPSTRSYVFTLLLNL
ncbi:SusC/RagA family TonB-linked outer membrane protein [Roseivirga sp. BDSF3-8]|uniref:SusC/RagA family TonB-linked outer membrane protein n=1 Tax=Roseivirga sp. BDSF3-8 TaxID=3241598 RepID=UPI003531BA66